MELHVIVLDEQLAAPDVAELFARWYPGQVLAVTALRPHARLLDPEIPGYLLQLRQPTFVTINYRHFWRRDLTHPRYCIICLKLRQDEDYLVSATTREVLSLPELKTKRRRMGKVISWSNGEIKWHSFGQAG